jgi:hypothetical protein
VQVVEPGLDRDALRLGLGRDVVEPGPEPLLDLVRGAFDGHECLVALALETAAEVREPGLDALDGAVRHVVDPLGEHAIRLAREPLDGEVELAPEPPRRVLARRADRRLELLRGRLRVARRLA